MSEAPLTDTAVQRAGGHADKELHAGFISKQTPLSQRQGVTDALPAEALQPQPRRSGEAPPLQVEGQGPEVMMEPLRQHDGVERRRAVAEAMRQTDEEYAGTTARDLAS